MSGPNDTDSPQAKSVSKDSSSVVTPNKPSTSFATPNKASIVRNGNGNGNISANIASAIATITPPPSNKGSDKLKTPASTQMSISSSGYAFISHSQQTYLTQTPSIDNMQLARRKRRRTSPQELNVLEKEFLIDPKPSKQLREQIAKRVDMTEKAVQIWFQNKRQATRKQAQKSNSSSSISKLQQQQQHQLPRKANKSEKICLSMGDNGKASVITAQKTPTRKGGRIKSLPLSPVKSSLLNQQQTGNGGKSPSAREKECISNLLSLRDWTL